MTVKFSDRFSWSPDELEGMVEHHKRLEQRRVEKIAARVRELTKQVRTLYKWEESDHPRAPAGQSTGGQFVAGSGGSGGGQIQDKHGVSYQVSRQQNPEGSGRFHYKVTNASGKEVAHAHLSGANEKQGRPINTRVMSVGVDPALQRRGIASALYDHIERDLGHKLKPNPVTTDAGSALWTARQRSSSSSSGEEHAGSSDGHDRTGILDDGSYHISDADKKSILDMLDKGESPEKISAHPAIKAADQWGRALPETKNEPGYGSPAWRTHRKFANGIIGYESAVDYLLDKANSYSQHGPVRQDKEATILLGPPASGKSYFAEQLAAKEHAAIVDPDDAKKLFTEFRGGVGANAVHEESGLLAGLVQKRLVVKGSNLVLPKVGKGRSAIEDLTKTLKDSGYKVNLVNMEVSEDNAFRRSIKRFLQTGRLISKEYTAEVDGNPTKTFDALKGTGLYAQVVAIDNNQRPGNHRITEGQETKIGRDLTPKG